jgi:ankyrin repeat protein
MKCAIIVKNICLLLLVLIPSLGLCQSQEEAKSLFNEALAIQERAKSLEDLGKASRIFLQALSIFEKVGSTEGMAKSCTNLAIICRKQKEYMRALEYYRKALSLSPKIRDPEFVAQLLSNIGLLHMHLDEDDKAEEYFQKALAANRQLNDPKIEKICVESLESIRKSRDEETSKDKNYLLRNACLAGKINKAQRLLKAGADVNGKNDEGRTPLVLAAMEGHADLVRTLIAFGANVNIQDKYGMTALMWAAHGCHLATVQLLVDHGADVAVMADKGITALKVAEGFKCQEQLKALLVKHGAATASASMDECASLLKEAAQVIKGEASGDPRKAFEDLQKALAIFEKSGNKKGACVATQMMGNACLLIGGGEAEGRALEYWKKAIQISREMSDKTLEAMVLIESGRELSRVGKTADGLSSLHRALTLSRELGDILGEKDSLAELATAYESLGEYQKALRFSDQALAVCRKQRDAAGESSELNIIGGVYQSLGQYKKALECHKEALAIARELSQVELEAHSLGNMSIAYRRSGQYQKALELEEQALPIFKKLGAVKDEVISLANIAGAYEPLGQWAKALELREKALALSKKLGDARGEACQLGNLATIYRELGQYQKALELEGQALALFKKLGAVKDEVISLANMAQYYSESGQFKTALEYHEEALALCRKFGQSDESHILNNIASLYLTMGDIPRAEAILSKKVDSPYRGCLSVMKSCSTADTRGRLALMQSDFKAALAEFQELVGQGNETRIVNLLFAGHSGLGLAYEGLKEYGRASHHFQQAVLCSEEIRETLTPSQRKTFYHAQVNGFPRILPYEGLARVLLKMNNHTESFKWAESTKARIFAETLSQRAVNIDFDLPKAALTEDNDINQRYFAILGNLQNAREKGSPEAVESFEEQVKAVQAERAEHISKLRQNYPLFAATKYPQPMDLKDSALGPDEWVIEYEVTDSGICVYLIKGKKIVKTVFKTIERKALDDLVRTFREPFEGVRKSNLSEKLKSFDLAIGKKLSDCLLSDLISDLPKGVPVIIVPYDSLEVLPFEMLVLNSAGRIKESKGTPYVTGAEFFGDRNPVSYYQSITALTLARTLGKKKQTGDKVLVMADPVFELTDKRAQENSSQSMRLTSVEAKLYKELMIAVEDGKVGGLNFSRLPLTSDLAKKLGDLYKGKSEIYTDLQASKDVFLKQIAPKLEDFQNIVFATHGYFGKDLPGIMEPALVLTTVPSGTDGYLRLSEVMGLKMNADMVALTACQSGLGRNISGEGTMGMGRAFQYAGAKSVLMSLWSVAQGSSVQLVERFFQHTKEGKGKLEALRLARHEIRESGFDHPFFWAPFILVGEVGPEAAGFEATSSTKTKSKQHQTTPAQNESPHPLMDNTPRDPAKDKELLKAAQKGDVSRVKKLLAEGADINSADPENGGTPLHWASNKDQQKVINCLLEQGADINAVDKDGMTPLIMAAAFGHRGVIELLLRHNADRTVKDKDGKTALDWAEGRKNKDIVRLLKK